jgi:hypothetical protein
LVYTLKTNSKSSKQNVVIGLRPRKLTMSRLIYNL